MRRILKAVSPFTVSSRFLLALIFAVFLPSTAQAAGLRQTYPGTTDGTDIWKSEFDVSKLRLKKGTYNFIVNAKDAAGNVGVAGPFNVKVDPMAGLPETRIIFPEQGMVIRSDFTIVGTATAKYGLKQVLLKINNGEYKEVEGGREYWSVKIPVEEFPDGDYTIYAMAIDTNDLAGPEMKINFTLDAITPSIEVTSHEIGDFISGNAKITGRVFDANGLKSLEISTDGENFTPLRHRAKRGEPGRHFQFTIKTKQGKKTFIDDGQIVYHIRAVNGTGWAETRPFLFFVNNDPPKIEILTPGKEEDVFGDIQVSGRVISAVGLEEFYYEWAGVRETIPLLQGNPFWSVQFFISMGDDRMKSPFRVTAVDRSGNSTTVTQRLNDRRRFGTPTVVIDYPPMPRARGGIMELAYDQPIYGHVEPWGYFPNAVFNNDMLEYLSAKPSFRIDPKDSPEGRGSFPLWAIAEDDTTGYSPVSISYNRAPPPPGVSLTYTDLIIDSPAEYGDMDDDGIRLISWVGESVTVRGSISNYSQGQTLEYRLKWDDRWKPIEVNSRGTFDTEISLAGIPQGPVPMELRTVRGGRGDYPVYLPVNKYTTMPVVRFLTPHQRFGTVHRSMTTSGIIEYYVPLDEVSYSYDGIEYEPIEFIAKEGMALFFGLFDYTAMHYNEETLIIRVVDRAGNVVEVSPDVPFDDTGDFPVIILNSPLEDELVTGDFTISGLAMAPIDIDAVYWRIRSPNNPWDAVETTLSRRGAPEYRRMATTQTYDLTLTLDDVRDGENILEIFAEDFYGLAGEVTRRVFRVSTTAPEAVVLEPEMDQWNRGNITVKGTVYDLNGIESIEISMDYGLSYQRADFTSNQTEASPWNITINTRAYADGVHSMLVRATDKYGVSAFSGCVINIDNTPPVIDISSPNDGDRVGEELYVTGQVYDNLDLLSLYLEIVNIEDPHINVSLNLPIENVIMEPIDVTLFPDGNYSVRVSAFDKSLNETAVIRNVILQKSRGAAEVAFFNPMPGIEHCGPLVVTGRVTGAVIPEEVTLLLNNRRFDNIEVDQRYGIFRYEFPEEGVNLDAPLVFSAAFIAPGGQRIVSYNHTVKLNSFGPVIVVDSHNDGDVITKRPYISGRAFLVRTIEEEHIPKSLVTSSVTKVELSLDNGRTFNTADGTNNWKYRLESAYLPAGVLPVIIKASFIDGRIAYRRILLTVDIRPPVVNVLGPTENSAHRDKISIYGSTRDNFDIDSVEVILRSGDKFLYQVPGFIQGLYFDASVLGGVQYATGFGLTFFDDNVKVQAVAARGADNSRYSNWAFGGKVLANVYTTKLDRWFGPDWEFWTTSLTLGAQFLYFLMEEDENRVWMGQFLGQWEIIKADMSYFYPNWKYFKSYSLYMDHGIWFAPSDINSQQAWRTKYTIAFGIRISLF